MAVHYDYTKRKRSGTKNPFKPRHGKRKEKGRRDTTRAAYAAVVIVIVAAAACVFMYDRISPDSDISNNIYIFFPELMTKDYSMVEVDVVYGQGQGVVSLTHGCKRIAAYVEPYQAESIYRGINRIYAERPNSHDIATDALENFGIEVLMVKVTELKDNAFHGRLILKSGNRIVSLDARPSDATAIAVRVGAPVYVKDELMQSQGEDVPGC